MLGKSTKLDYAENAWWIYDSKTYEAVSDSWYDFCEDYLRCDGDEVLRLLCEAEDNSAPFFGWDPPRQPVPEWGKEPFEAAILAPEPTTPTKQTEGGDPSGSKRGARTGEGSTAVAPAVTTLGLSEITLDTNLQVRAQLNSSRVKQYAQRMLEGDVFPRPVVYVVGSEILLADGWHRYFAAREAGYNTLECELRRGTRTDAFLHAMEANSTHGAALTNRDKRHCVTQAVLKFGDLSNRLIAQMAKVSHTFVSKIRQLATDASSEVRTGRDGRKRRVARRPSAPHEREDHNDQPEQARDGQATRNQQAEEQDVGGDHPKTKPDEPTGSNPCPVTWQKVECFLAAALESRQESSRKAFCDQLHEWANRHCP